MRLYGQHRACQASRSDETLKNKPNLYKPGKVRVHQMGKRERERYEKQRKELREKYPWRYAKKRREYQPLCVKNKKDLNLTDLL